MRMKDYIKLAQALKDNRLNNISYASVNLPDDTPVILARRFLNALCGILAADNPKFDKVKFMEACK